MRVGKYAAVFAATMGFVAAGAGPATAGPSSGVHTDPGSPTAKQYAIPIPAARGETSGQAFAGASANPPLFGVGVTAADPPGTSTGAGPGVSVSQADGAGAVRHHLGQIAHGQPQSASGSARSRAPNAARATVRTDAADTTGGAGSASWLPLLGGGVLVLLLGGGGGLWLRLRS